MLVIRFFRVGKKNQPSFKIVVTDKRKPPRAGRFAEEVGFYNPKTKEKVLKAERIKYWLSVGAKPSDTVHNLLVSEKIIEGKKTPIHIKKTKKEPSVASASADLSAEAQGAKAEATAIKEEKPKEEKALVEEKPVAEKSAEEKSAEETPKEEKEKVAKEEKPVAEKPDEEKPAEEKPTEKKPETESSKEKTIE